MCCLMATDCMFNSYGQAGIWVPRVPRVAICIARSTKVKLQLKLKYKSGSGVSLISAKSSEILCLRKKTEQKADRIVAQVQIFERSLIR